LDTFNPRHHDEDEDLTQYEESFDDLRQLTPESYFDEVPDEDQDYDFDSEDDDAELERRRTKYAELKKDDKIFNNTYNLGYETSEDDIDDSENTRGAKDIRVDPSSPDYFLYDPDKYSEHVDSQIIQKEIFTFIAGNAELNTILGPEPERKKFVKTEINDIFKLLCTHLITRNNRNYFITPIYILDAISVTVSMDYKKLFDMLTYENKEVLLLELNTKYGFLDKLTKSNKMF
jgi:hypothetical protein